MNYKVRRFFFALRGQLKYRRIALGLLPDMIVCSCNVLTDQDVRAAVSADTRPRSASQVYGCLGCSAQCGRCATTIRQIMDEALDSAAVACGDCKNSRQS
jgi:bacterioferritin-associated ferredoxin